jgi:hypothetical protein
LRIFLKGNKTNSYLNERIFKMTNQNFAGTGNAAPEKSDIERLGRLCQDFADSVRAKYESDVEIKSAWDEAIGPALKKCLGRPVTGDARIDGGEMMAAAAMAVATVQDVQSWLPPSARVQISNHTVENFLWLGKENLAAIFAPAHRL